MSEDSQNAAAAMIDGDAVMRELRLQLQAVKACMQAHRETMEAAGLTATTPQTRDEGGGRLNSAAQTSP